MVDCRINWWQQIRVQKIDGMRILSSILSIWNVTFGNHVEKDEPPMFDGSEASTQLLKQMYPESIEIVLSA